MQGSRLIGVVAVLAGLPALAPAESMEDARRLWLEGKYAEASEIYAPSAGELPAAALGLARCLAAEGKLDDAVATLEAGGEHAELHAELARLAFERGDRRKAERHVEAALGLDPAQLLARWIEGELFRTAGRLAEAERAYARLIRHYNEREITSAESLRWVGLAAARYAEWNRAHDQFRFLVGELYPASLRIEPAYWPAHYEAGRLFLKKYNQRDAAREFQAALALNPNAAEVHAAMARLALDYRDVRQAETSLRRALEINPKLLEARLLGADLAWANFRPQEALQLLRDEALSLDPACEETLGRMAACYVLEDGLDGEGRGGRFGRLADEVTARNEHAGEFYFALAEWLSARHRISEAERFYREAMRRMPRQVGPAAALGMLWMAMGQEERAKKQLLEAREADPFNVRTTNMLSVLEVLDGMETVESEQVVLRFDPADKLLGRYALRYIDKLYPELCEQFGYRPPDKPLVEIFRTARGGSGRAWFSARMTGLPYLGTVAASTGKIVAMVSPSDAGVGKPFNWARVLRHEMVHVVTLQQTRFNIPHWYTEALAVHGEGYPRPQAWNELLVRRVSEGELFDLGTINFGFSRPSSGEDWQLAYCQAELYAEYLIRRHGPEAVGALLAAYADNLATAEAIPRALGVAEEEFERGYRAYLAEAAGSLPGLAVPTQKSFAELLAAQREEPRDAELAAQTAYGYLRRGAYEEARQLSATALELAPRQQLAAYVLARILIRGGQTDQAAQLLEKSLDRDAPDSKALNLLAALKLKTDDYAEAARWYQLGACCEPENLRWTRALALVHSKSGDDERLAEALAVLARAEANDLASRKELTRLALARRDFEAAADWANQALWIDVEDAEVHRAFAEALAAGHNETQAIEEFLTATELDPTAPAPRLGLAEAYVRAGRTDEARRVLEDLLRLAPDYPGADPLLKALHESDPP